MKRTFLLLLSTSTMISSLHAQQEYTTKYINQLEVGIGHQQQRDFTLNTLRFQGLSYSISYRRTFKSSNISQLSVCLSNAHIGNRFEQANNLSAQINISYAYLLRVVNGAHFQMAIGIKPTYHFNVAFYPNWDESHLYWNTALTPRWSGQWSYTFNNGKSLQLNTDIGFIALFGRSPKDRYYKIDDFQLHTILGNFHRFNQLAFAKNYFTIHSQLTFSLNKRIAINYLLGYQTSNICWDNSYAQINHQLGLNYSF